MRDVTPQSPAGAPGARLTDLDYQQIVMHMVDGFALHQILCDAAGQPVDYLFLQVNPAFEKFTGIAAAQIIGKTVLEVMPQTEPCWIERFGRVALTGTEFHGEEYSRVLGRHFEVKAWRTFPGRFACTFHDITERKRAQERQRLSEERFRHLAESLSDWIWEVDANGIYTFASAKVSDLLGYSPAEIIGKIPFDFMPAAEATRVRPQFAMLMAAKAPLRDVENWNVTKDGRRVCLLTNGVPFFGPGGELAGYRGVDRDITALKLEQVKSQQMAKLSSLGEMSSGIAHEINNPIAGVINCAELLRSRLPSGDPLQEIVGRISRDGTRISRIVHSLLSVAHPGRKRREQMTVPDLFDGVLSLFEGQLAKDGIELRQTFVKGLPELYGERQQLEQLLLNLISNARHALNEKYPGPHPDKRLTLGARHEGGGAAARIALEIHDCGTGIRPEVLAKIFDPFFTTKPAGVGTGLGLGLCFEIVKRHGGEIRVESEFGEFTRIVVDLPPNLPGEV